MKKNWTYKNKIFSSELLEKSVERNWFKMLWVRIFGKRYYGLDDSKDGVYVTEMRFWKGKWFLIKSGFQTSAKEEKEVK